MPQPTRTLVAVCALTVLAVAGCSSPQSAPDTGAAAPSVISVPAAPSASATFATDLAGPVNEALSNVDTVSGIEQTGSASVQVNTTIVDPRGEDGSAEAAEALAVCETAAAAVDGIQSLTVNEADGTGLALYRTDAGTLGPSGECFEY